MPCPPWDPNTPAARGRLEAADAAPPVRCASVRVVLEGTALEHLRPQRRPSLFELFARTAGIEPGHACAVLHLLLSLLPGAIEELLALLLVGPLLRFLLGTPLSLALPYVFKALLESLPWRRLPS